MQRMLLDHMLKESFIMYSTPAAKKNMISIELEKLTMFRENEEVPQEIEDEVLRIIRS